MENDEVMTLNVDISGADKPIKEMGDALDGLRKIVNDIGNIITKAFISMQKSLQKIEGSILLMTAALLAATQAMGMFANSFLKMQSAEQSAIGLLDVFNTVLAVISTIAGRKSYAAADRRGN